MATTMSSNDPRPLFDQFGRQALTTFSTFFDDQVDWIDAHLADVVQAQAARKKEDPAVNVAKLIQTPSRQKITHAQRSPLKSAARPMLSPLVYSEQENEASPIARKNAGFAAGRAMRKAEKEWDRARSPLGVSRSIQHDVFGSPPPQPPAFARILSPAKITPPVSKSTPPLLPAAEIVEAQRSPSPAVEEVMLVDMNSPIKSAEPSPAEEQRDEIRDDLAGLAVSQSITSLLKQDEAADLSIISEGSEPDEASRPPGRTISTSLFSVPTPSEPIPTTTPASTYQPIASSPLKQVAVEASSPAPASSPVQPSPKTTVLAPIEQPTKLPSPRVRQASPPPALTSTSRLPMAMMSPKLRQEGRAGSPKPGSPLTGQRPMSPRLAQMSEAVKRRAATTSSPSRIGKGVEVPLKDSTSQSTTTLTRSLHRTPTTTLFSATSASVRMESGMPTGGRKSSGGSATAPLPPSPTSTFLSKNPTRTSLFTFGGLQARSGMPSLSSAYNSERPSLLASVEPTRTSLGKRNSDVVQPDASRAAKVQRVEEVVVAPVMTEARVEAMKARVAAMSKSMGARQSVNHAASIGVLPVAPSSPAVVVETVPSPAAVEVEALPSPAPAVVEAAPLPAPAPAVIETASLPPPVPEQPAKQLSPIKSPSPAPLPVFSPVQASQPLIDSTTTPPFTPPVASHTFSAPRPLGIQDDDDDTRAMDADTEPEDAADGDISNAMTMVDEDETQAISQSQGQTVFFEAETTEVLGSPQLPTSPPGAFPEDATATQIMEEHPPRQVVTSPTPSTVTTASLATSAGGLISQAASIFSKSFGAKKQGKPEVKSLQLAAAAAKKEQQEKERKATLKAERLAASHARDDRDRTIIEADRKRKEPPSASMATGPAPSASSQAIATALVPKGKMVRPKQQPSQDVAGEAAKKRKLETGKAVEAKKANEPPSRPASAMSQSSAQQFRPGHVRKPSAGPSSAQPPIRPVAKPAVAAPLASTSASSMIGVKYMPEPNALRTATTAPVRPKPLPAVAAAPVVKVAPAPQRASSKPIPPRASQKIAVVAAAVAEAEYVELPDIDSEYSDPADVEGHNQRAAARPSWAQSPAMRAALQLQNGYNPVELFGRIPPLQMEDIFRGDRQSRFRARTSSANWNGADRLTNEEEAAYAKRMGYLNT